MQTDRHIYVHAYVGVTTKNRLQCSCMKADRHLNKPNQSVLSANCWKYVRLYRHSHIHMCKRYSCNVSACERYAGDWKLLPRVSLLIILFAPFVSVCSHFIAHEWQRRGSGSSGWLANHEMKDMKRHLYLCLYHTGRILLDEWRPHHSIEFEWRIRGIYFLSNNFH